MYLLYHRGDVNASGDNKQYGTLECAVESHVSDHCKREIISLPLDRDVDVGKDYLSIRAGSILLNEWVNDWSPGYIYMFFLILFFHNPNPISESLKSIIGLANIAVQNNIGCSPTSALAAVHARWSSCHLFFLRNSLSCHSLRAREYMIDKITWSTKCPGMTRCSKALTSSVLHTYRHLFCSHPPYNSIAAIIPTWWQMLSQLVPHSSGQIGNPHAHTLGSVLRDFLCNLRYTF